MASINWGEEVAEHTGIHCERCVNGLYCPDYEDFAEYLKSKPVLHNIWTGDHSRSETGAGCGAA